MDVGRLKSERDAQQRTRFEVPELNIAYQPVDWSYANHPQSPFTIPND